MSNKQPNQQMSRRSKWTFPKKTYRWLKRTWNGAHITNYQRNANQNYNKVLPYIGQNGHQKIYKQ